jgi:hypothetical protein
MATFRKRHWTLTLVALVSLATIAQIPAASRSSGAANRPNVLIIVTDDQREGFRVMPKVGTG